MKLWNGLKLFGIFLLSLGGLFAIDSLLRITIGFSLVFLVWIPDEVIFKGAISLISSGTGIVICAWILNKFSEKGAKSA